MQYTRTLKILMLTVPVVALGAAAAAWIRHSATRQTLATEGEQARYQCPMHPQIVQDHPGDCPICHMHLEKVEDGTAAKPKILKYRNPMDPKIFSDRPMKDSMGMDYIPVYADQAGDDSGVEGKAGFALSPERQQLIGVRTAVAEVGPLSLTVRMPGRAAAGGRVLAQLLEIDAGSLKPGMKARLQGPGGASVEAIVLGVSGQVDSTTGSFGVTLRLSGPAPWLAPGAFCQVLAERDLGRHLVVPQEAILDTGLRQVLFVAIGKGRFEPREVLLGQAGDDLVEVRQGLKAGEAVVTSANFLIDSESRFRAALKQFSGAGHD